MTPSAAAAGTWVLGDRTVNRVGLGAMRLTGTAAFSLGVPRPREQAVAVLRRAVELGVDHVDTASFYFSSLRSANELIARALSPYPDELLIATKVGPSRDPSGAWLPPATPEQLRGQVEENLRQLGRDSLDLVYLRVQGTGPVGEHLAALSALQDAGLVRHLGVSGVTPAQLREALAAVRVVSVQNRFGLDVRRDDDVEVLRLCAEHGVAFVPFFAVAGAGADRGADGAQPARVQAVADAHGSTATQVRLAWTLHQGPHVLAIPGTGDPAHVDENVAAGALRLTADELASLDPSGS